jgi:hypothetical protein
LGDDGLTEERALKIFARCYNKGDFADIARRLHKKASFEAFYRFYRNEGRENVQGILTEKAAELRALPVANRAYYGFMMVKHDVIGLRAESCLVLTKDDPWQVEGVVRIKCTALHIKDIRILDPDACKFTRGDFAGKEGC